MCRSDYLLSSAARLCAASSSDLTHAGAKEQKNTLHHCHRLRVRFMFYLKEESHVAPGSNNANDCTRLEKAMTAFRQLLTLDSINRRLDYRYITIMTILLTEQSILVCWKNGDYDLAAAVLQRQYQSCQDLSVEACLDTINTAVKVKNTEVWEKLSKYSDMIDFAKQLLKKVFAELYTPDILRMGVVYMHTKRYAPRQLDDNHGRPPKFFQRGAKQGLATK